MTQQAKIDKLTNTLKGIYKDKSSELLFHGWHHIVFVRNKALIFAKSIDADKFFVESAALVHDLNYIVEINSTQERGSEYREELLFECGYNGGETKLIEKIIMEIRTAYRNKDISNEGKALSDGDTLFKVLPITPILFSSHYIAENQVDIAKLAKKITSEQNKLLDGGYYFYTELAKKKYLKWAKVNLSLWNNVVEALEDEDISGMLEMAQEIGVL